VEFHETPLGGAWVVDLERRSDERGWFARAFCEREFAAHGLLARFPQCNLSSNDTALTLRGMHYNAAPFGEAKLIRCVRGEIHDVIVDLRPGSPTHLDWFGITLTAREGRAVFVPGGFAHGFLTLCDDADVFYHMGEFHRPDAERGFRWNDPAVGIDWPADPAVISSRDGGYADLVPGAIEA
jgi:dTDP-4-dehydrorhamnose 3,5-epimerase